MTVIRDATRVGNGVYAVGGAVTRQLCAAAPFTSPPCGNTDTPILWRFDGTNTPTLEALPDFDSVTAVNQIAGGFDITSDGRYIASQARVSNAPLSGFSTRAVRVETAQLPSPGLNLNTTFSPALTYPTTATAISGDGMIVYGFGSPAGPVRAIRFDASGTTSLVIPLLCPAVSLPECPAADTTNFVFARGTSSNGDVAVGASFIAAAAGNPPGPHKAFRYVHGAGVTAIPLLPGGTSNDAIALSPDGDLVLVIGNGTGAPNSEPYLYRASNGTIQRLGSPNANLLEAWAPGGRICANDQGNCAGRALAGGMSADGSVVAMNFAGGSVTGGQYAYFHNPHGWFHLTSALFAHGIDLGTSGWNPQTLLITGVSPDGTLIFGTGAQNGVVKGFVADFPAGALASFNPSPSPPADPFIVGAWTQPDEIEHVVFSADGAYYHIGRMEFGGNVTSGFERGHYTYSGGVLTVATLFDTNGKHGLSDGNGSTFPVAVVGDTLTFLDDPQESQLQRIVGGPGSIVGAWVGGNPTEANNSIAVVATPTRLFNAIDLPDNVYSDFGTYTWNPTSGAFVFTPNGGTPDDPDQITVSSDERSVHVVDDDGEVFDLTRVVDPRTPLITSALNAVATTGLPFSYQITATNSPTTFGAIGLPPWLAFDVVTGIISGTPPEVTTLDIRIEASNALSTITGRNHLSLVVIDPVTVPTGPTTVTPIPADEPGEAPPVTIEFENVTNGGTISLVSIDPEADADAPAPPSGFSLGDDPVYFEILAGDGLTFTGPVEVCFSYAGITFSGFPRLLHYDEELMTWVDITTSVDTANQIICGLTSSFSPFVIAATARETNGFAPPIKPVADQLNSVKGGATVALKFNVFGEGNVEITDPAALGATFTVAQVACEGGTPSSSDILPTTGNTGLRYDTSSHQFVQNWKTPALPGCYLVQVKGEGLLLSALFKVR